MAAGNRPSGASFLFLDSCLWVLLSAVSYFVTGTDTGAGKTRFSCLLVEALRARGPTLGVVPAPGDAPPPDFAAVLGAPPAPSPLPESP